MIKFSIIIPCYNQDKYIAEAVESALRQKYENKEIIVVDDGSNDGSHKVLERYNGKIVYKKNHRNIGPELNRNKGAAIANGDYLVFLDGDDVLLPWALNVYKKIIDIKNPNLILCNLRYYMEEISYVSDSEIPDGIEVVQFSNCIEKDRTYRASASAIIVERETFENVNGFSEKSFPMDDLDLLLKLGYSGRTVQILSPKTIGYRIHSSNVVHQVSICINKLIKIINKEKSKEFPGGRMGKYERYAFIGGPVFFWVKKAFRYKKYYNSVQLLAYGMPMIMVAIVRRAFSIIRGKKHIECYKL